MKQIKYLLIAIALYILDLTNIMLLALLDPIQDIMIKLYSIKRNINIELNRKDEWL